MILKFWLLDLWSRVEEGVETAHLYGFDGDGSEVELVDDSVRPFLLAEEEAFQIYDGPFISSIEKRDGLTSRIFAKIKGKDATKDIPRIRRILEEQGVRTLEADIYYTSVYMKERGFKPCTWHLITNANHITRADGFPTERSEVPERSGGTLVGSPIS